MSEKKDLRVGAFQFRSSADITQNCEAILRGMQAAARKKVRLLALPECALSGYLGVDLDAATEIDRAALAAATKQIAAEAKRHKMYVALGTTTFAKEKVYNTLRLLGADGRGKSIYHKRGMYQDDRRHYTPGDKLGICTLDGIRTGLRLCFDFRFPEYFRELLYARARLAVMGFCMVGKTAKKLPIARAHLMSRAAENGLWILAANNCRGVQNCPTCLVDPTGEIIAEADTRKETLLTGTVAIEPLTPLQANIVKEARRLRREDKASR